MVLNVFFVPGFILGNTFVGLFLLFIAFMCHAARLVPVRVSLTSDHSCKGQDTRWQRLTVIVLSLTTTGRVSSRKCSEEKSSAKAVPAAGLDPDDVWEVGETVSRAING